VAEELGNALVLPINPYAPSAPKTLGAQIATLSDDVYGRLLTDVLNTAIEFGGFKNVVMMGDTAIQGIDPALESLATKLDRDWTARGVRVFVVNLHEITPGQGGLTFNNRLFEEMGGPNDSS
jgi:hypothetical protein